MKIGFAILAAIFLLFPVSASAQQQWMPEVRLDFVPRGDPANKYAVASGKFGEKEYWYYEPNIDPATGAGWIRFELTDGNVKKAFGINYGAYGTTLGVLLTYLDAEGTIVFMLDHWAHMDKPGKALHYDVSFTPEVFARIKTVVLRPSVDAHLADYIECRQQGIVSDAYWDTCFKKNDLPLDYSLPN
jgi:hypothetical protein